MSDSIPWGPTGRVVFERTYSRVKEDGSRETWPETVARVVKGNLALAYGDDMTQWPDAVHREASDLYRHMVRFAIIPGGRHLAATGVPGRQYLFNCHVAGWGEKLSDHFEFSALRLFEGGGVGANYSSRFLRPYGYPKRHVHVGISCREDHQDIDELRPFLAGTAVINRPSYFEVEDTREGWAAALVYLINTAMSESLLFDSIIFNVSSIRPSGSVLKSSGGTASGPGPLARMLLDVAAILSNARSVGELRPGHAMEIDHAISEAVVSGGNRRSARMAIVHWNDDAVVDFIRCKQDTGKHWTTNISVEVDDEFFEQLNVPGSWAQKVHEAVVAGMLANGEPGYWNSSLSSEGEVGEVIATNPCGEISLEAWENCNLGHVNLDAFAPKTKDGPPDGTGLLEAHRLITRFLMRATFGDVNDPKQAVMLARNRRIGVGHLGVQGFWAKQGVKYSELPDTPRAATMLDSLYGIVREEAQRYAFELRIPEPVKVTCVAPTGTIAKMPGVSEGIHPIYARHFERRVRFSMRDDFQFNQVHEAMGEGFEVEDDQYDKSGMTKVVVYPTEDILVAQVRALGWPDDVVESADQLSVWQMLAVQRLYQDHWADNAVSYTVNIQAGDLDADELAEALWSFLPYLKGTTIMVDESRPQAPYTRISAKQYDDARARTVADSTDENCATGACPVK